MCLLIFIGLLISIELITLYFMTSDWVEFIITSLMFILIISFIALITILIRHSHCH